MEGGVRQTVAATARPAPPLSGGIRSERSPQLSMSSQTLLRSKSVSQQHDSLPKKEEKKARGPRDPHLHWKAYKFRLSPTKKQVGKLEWMLRRCKELYNAALEERREAYRMCGISVSYRMQADQLPAIKRLREEYSEIHSQVLQDVLKRLDRAFQAFFRR